MARDQRRLAAIVSADVAGYSRLMGQDESGTLAALKAHRRDLIDAKIAEYGGRIVKTTGDGLLLEFPSVVDAVRCAVDVQRGMAERNAGAPPERRIDFRVGINVGDIIIDGDDIYGDGVNVAARLQTLAEPGEIYVSKVVRDQVLDKLNFSFEDLGAQKVKNIARPVEAFRVDLGASALPTTSSHKWNWQRLTRSRISRWMGAGVVVALAGIAVWTLTQRLLAPAPQSASNAIAVLPFVASDGSPEEQQLADTITRDLTSMLGRGARLSSVVSQDVTAPYKGKRIDARNVGRELGALYLVEGEVRRVGEHADVNVQVVETAAATQVWADRFEVDPMERKTGPSSLIALLDDRISRSIFAANMRRYASPPSPKAGAVELTMHGWAVWSRDNNTVRGAREARKWFDQALVVDPNFVPAISGKIRTLYYELDFEPNVDKVRVLKEMDELTFLATNIDSTNPSTWAGRADLLIRQRRWDAALEASTKAEKVLSAPNAALLAQRADIKVFTGRPEEALALADRALSMDPTDKEEMGWIMLQRCRAFMAMGRYDEAIASCERNVALDNWWLPHLYLVAGYALREGAARATAEKATLLELRPSASIADVKRYAWSDNAAFVQQTETHLLAGLRKAGLPEQ